MYSVSCKITASPEIFRRICEVIPNLALNDNSSFNVLYKLKCPLSYLLFPHELKLHSEVTSQYFPNTKCPPANLSTFE